MNAGITVDAAYLQKFCADEEDFRWYLAKPWSVGEWTYATNGHIMIRVPRLPDIAEEERAPNIDKTMAKIPAAKDWAPVPECDALPLVPCEKCHGNKIVECNFGHDHDCEWCDGDGKVPQVVAVTIGEAAFNQNYLSMVQGFEISTTGTNTGAHIRNGEIAGMVMPMRTK